ncbi:MAG: ATP-binding cassette domain-containing protein, partial [Lachnospiraceae bacterium]|nr:ATP-binding cassette domain-containing protein [Lachnospiraceae bacterium]
MFFYLFVLIRYSVLLTSIGLFSILIDILMAKIISGKRVNLTRVQMRDSGKLSGLTVSGIEMIESIKAGGAENGFFARWSGFQASVNSSKNKFVKLNSCLGMIPAIVSSLTNTLILIIGIGLTMRGEFTLGMVMAFDGLLVSFTGPASQLISAGQMIQEMRTNMERVEDVMLYPSDKNVIDRNVDAGGYRKLNGEIELKNITFGYSRLGKPVIKDFNMSIKPGSRVAFVGSSGCGKSTLAKLISGLYDPWQGDILFEGKHIREIDRNIFTGSVAVVDQDIILFEDSIKNNIKMWDDSIEDFEMIMAARDAQIHDDIMLRNGGYEHKLIEGGRNFSGGQRQRLEIARVLAQDPTVIILDEATSALDAKTEYEVVKAIKDRGITCIVIAHRLSTIRDSDEIVVLDHGEVVERGTHEELFKKNGYYTELVTSE